MWCLILVPIHYCCTYVHRLVTGAEETEYEHRPAWAIAKQGLHKETHVTSPLYLTWFVHSTQLCLPLLL